MRILRIVLIAIIVLFAAQISFGQNVEYVGSAYINYITDVKTVGNYAYCTLANGSPVQSGLLIYDMTFPVLQMESIYRAITHMLPMELTV